MGRRSINTTKSGKFMNPTDQARKEARKRELKKNKKQRMAVRHAVLKGKDPLKLLEDMELIDKMEYDPSAPPKLNEKVLKDKRKKLMETFERVMGLYEKEDPEYALELRKAKFAYEKKMNERQTYYEQVKMAEQVQLEEIPLPEAPSIQPVPSQIPLPNDIPELEDKPLHSILKKHSESRVPHNIPQVLPMAHGALKRKAPGPPPGPPPDLSDTDDESDHEMKTEVRAMRRVEVPPPVIEADHPPAKSRKIRFEDDSFYDPSAPEKDTRPKFKPGPPPPSSLQVKMLKMAQMAVPNMEEDEIEDKKEFSADDMLRKRQEDALRKLEELQAQTKGLPMPVLPPGTEEEKMDASDDTADGVNKSSLPPGPPPGLPPGLPPGPPPGLPPMMFRPPGIRSTTASNPPRMLPPGPPPGRPPGIPPGPPPGLPPNVRPRLPPGPPGIPPRLLRPPGVAPPGVAPTSAQRSTNVLSAPPSIKRLSKGGGQEEDSKKTGATITAKPKIKNLVGDATRFMPTALRVKRTGKDTKTKHIRTAADEMLAVKQQPQVAVKSKDDAYDDFMREMEGIM